MQILNIAGYKFIALDELDSLQKNLLELCHSLSLKGTILLGHEGININLAGIQANIKSFQTLLKNDCRFMSMDFHESCSDDQPFKYLKVKLKKEIITFGQSSVNTGAQRAPDISPHELKQWLDEKRDFILLDTRNNYEIQFGSFKGAINLHISDFGELPQAIKQIECDKPIVMFCTGGIRCEKAALYMLNQGYAEVYQLDGGILGYFKKIGSEHYEGECFVFDNRITLDSSLKETGTIQCPGCQGPVKTRCELCC